MKVSEAKKKVCPFISTPTELINCICETCMFWETTINGKKEVDRQKIPYDTYPQDEYRMIDRFLENGYEEVRLKGEFTSTFIKYEYANEGYCKRLAE